jgi:hypothetical protein
MVAMRTLVSLLGSMAVAAALMATAIIWLVLHDPVSFTTSAHGNLLMPIVLIVGRAIASLAQHL